jgi:PBP1b-binding outer membrane lipoprotein LpoB
MTDEKQEDAGKTDPVDQPKTTATDSLPALNFATFIFSLNSSALVQLGMIEDPMTSQKIKNLPLAKQTIDILSMLEEKTRGNLEADEAAMLKNVLYDLRILYVKEKG